MGQPLGIAYLGAMLEQEGHDVCLLDALMGGFLRGVRPEQMTNSLEPDRVRISKGVATRTDLGAGFPAGTFAVGMNPAAIAEEVIRFRPEVVGISLIFSSLHRMGLHLAELMKSVDRRIITVMGGSHVTVAPHEILAHGTVDYIVVGEGEYSFPALLKALQEGREIGKIPGIGFRSIQRQATINPPKLIHNLDTLAFPAFHLLPMEEYFATAAEGRIVKMYTSRGCTFDCCFCSVPYTSQRRFRAHAPERVVAEIERWVDEYAIESIMFEDDNMTLNLKRARRIFELIVARDFGLKLYARNFRCDLFDRDLLKLMKQAGFETIWITPESGSQRVLDQIIGKRLRLDDVIRSVHLIRDTGLAAAAAFVIGIPGETWSEIEDTIEFARKLKRKGVNEFWVSIATPIQGSRMYEMAMEKGLIERMNTDKFAYNEGVFDTNEFTAQQLNSLRDEMMGELNS